MTPWTPECVETLTRLWQDGRSAPAIAHELGITRNAVLGEVFRLRKQGVVLDERKSWPRRKAKSSQPCRQCGTPCNTPQAKYCSLRCSNFARPKRSRSKDTRKPNRKVATMEERETAFVCPSEGETLGIMDLHYRSCRFLYDGHDGVASGYCGHATAPGMSWCERHLTIVAAQGAVVEEQAGEAA